MTIKKKKIGNLFISTVRNIISEKVNLNKFVFRKNERCASKRSFRMEKQETF